TGRVFAGTPSTAKPHQQQRVKGMSTDATDTIDVGEMETSAGNELASTIAEGQPPKSPPEAPPAAPSEPEGKPATVTTFTGDGGTATATPPAAPEVTPEGTETTEGGEEAGGGDEVSIRGLFDRIAGSAPGHTMIEKYPDDGQFLRGMAHAQGMLGKRDADADLGRAFRSRFGSEAEMRAFLQGQSPAATPPQQQPPPAAETTPPTFDQVRLWQQQVASAQAAGQEPPAEVARQLDAVNQQMQRAAFELATNPQALLKPHLDQQAQQVNQVIQQSQQQQAAAVAQAQWVQQFEETHKGWIAKGGQMTPGNLTPDGERLMQHVAAEVQRGRSQAEALHYGLQALQAEKAQQQPTAPTVPPVKPQGHHKPAVAAAPAPNAEEVY
ncbi:hypothetical protein LCGC14_2920750, partial [marine sediment metagenome]